MPPVATMIDVTIGVKIVAVEICNRMYAIIEFEACSHNIILPSGGGCGYTLMWLAVSLISVMEALGVVLVSVILVESDEL